MCFTVQALLSRVYFRLFFHKKGQSDFLFSSNMQTETRLQARMPVICSHKLWPTSGSWMWWHILARWRQERSSETKSWWNKRHSIFTFSKMLSYEIKETLSCCDFLALTSETLDHAVLFPLVCFPLTMHCFKSPLSTFQTRVMSQLINDSSRLVHLSSNQKDTDEFSSRDINTYIKKISVSLCHTFTVYVGNSKFFHSFLFTYFTIYIYFLFLLFCVFFHSFFTF